MKKIKQSTAFKRDLKRFRHDKRRLRKIQEVTLLLAKGKEIPAYMRPHRLIGNYEGHMELHIEGDLLLIWIEHNDIGEEVIYLVRLGSHSELF